MRTRILVLFLTTLLGGCNFSASTGNAHPAHELTQFNPSAPDAKIRSVSFSESTNEKFDKTRVGTKLPATATQALVWYSWNGAESGRHVEITWYEDATSQVLLQQDEKLDKPFGESAWIFKSASGNALPAGQYRVELAENGAVVSKIPFTVGP